MGKRFHQQVALYFACGDLRYHMGGTACFRPTFGGKMDVFRGRWNRASHVANDGNTLKNINPNKKCDILRLNMHETQILSSKDVHFLWLPTPNHFAKHMLYRKTERKHGDKFPVWTGSLASCEDPVYNRSLQVYQGDGWTDDLPHKAKWVWFLELEVLCSARF